MIPNGNSSFLEEDSSEKLLFGDIFLICYEKNKIIDYCVSDYAEYYSIVFEGFDDCSDSNSEYDNDSANEDNEYGNNCDLKGFIVNDKSDDSDESYEYIDDEELDEDLNEY